MRRQSIREKKFCALYLGEANGNGVKAAKMAGYTGNYNTLGVTAHNILKKPNVQHALARKVNKDPHIASAKEILHFWTDTMEGEKVDMGYRLGASDRLAKVHRLIDGEGAPGVPNGFQVKRLTIMELQEVENKILSGEFDENTTDSIEARDEARDAED